MIEKKGYSLEYRGLSDENHFRFATKAEPNTLGQYGAKAKDATYIDMSGCYPLTRCYLNLTRMTASITVPSICPAAQTALI